MAAARFAAQPRHPGHLDGAVSQEQIEARFSELAQLGGPDTGHRLEVNTTREVFVDAVLHEIRALFLRHHG